MSDDDIKTAVAHRKGLGDQGGVAAKDRLPPRLQEIALAAGATAKNEILTAIVGRGYTAAQAASWMRGVEFQRHLTIFWALEEGKEFFSDQQLAGQDQLDRRKELWDVAPLLDADGNVIVVPPPSDPDQGVNYGVLKVRDKFDDTLERQRRWRGDWCDTNYRW